MRPDFNHWRIGTCDSVVGAESQMMMVPVWKLPFILLGIFAEPSHVRETGRILVHHRLSNARQSAIIRADHSYDDAIYTRLWTQRLHYIITTSAANALGSISLCRNHYDYLHHAVCFRCQSMYFLKNGSKISGRVIIPLTPRFTRAKPSPGHIFSRITIQRENSGIYGLSRSYLTNSASLFEKTHLTPAKEFFRGSSAVVSPKTVTSAKKLLI